MRVAVVRHAIAEDRESFAASGQPDELRPLTSRGRKKMYRAAQGLHALLPEVDLIATSPLLRAVATAEIVAAYYDASPIVQVPELAPGRSPRGVLGWMQANPSRDVIALVGHQPELGLLVGWLLCGREHPFLELKKGAVCLLEFPEIVEPGHARLLWAMKSSQLARFAE
jgi:phosphohistidine phosphatase